ncbi:hypothetical protein FWH30_00310, partial [Microgenomates group bacterium]|nr:hypothetical protein [Microgenomates group bacterium]
MQNKMATVLALWTVLFLIPTKNMVRAAFYEPNPRPACQRHSVEISTWPSIMSDVPVGERMDYVYGLMGDMLTCFYIPWNNNVSSSCTSGTSRAKGASGEFENYRPSGYGYEERSYGGWKTAGTATCWGWSTSWEGGTGFCRDTNDVLEVRYKCGTGDESWILWDGVWQKCTNWGSIAVKVVEDDDRNPCPKPEENESWTADDGKTYQVIDPDDACELGWSPAGNVSGNPYTIAEGYQKNCQLCAPDGVPMWSCHPADGPRETDSKYQDTPEGREECRNKVNEYWWKWKMPDEVICTPDELFDADCPPPIPRRNYFFCDPNTFTPRESNGGCADDGTGYAATDCAGCKAGDPIDRCGYEDDDEGLVNCGSNVRQYYGENLPADFGIINDDWLSCYRTEAEVEEFCKADVCPPDDELLDGYIPTGYRLRYSGVGSSLQTLIEAALANVQSVGRAPTGAEGSDVTGLYFYKELVGGGEWDYEKNPYAYGADDAAVVDPISAADPYLCGIKVDYDACPADSEIPDGYMPTGENESFSEYGNDVNAWIAGALAKAGETGVLTGAYIYRNGVDNELDFTDEDDGLSDDNYIIDADGLAILTAMDPYMCGIKIKEERGPLWYCDPADGASKSYGNCEDDGSGNVKEDCTYPLSSGGTPAESGKEGDDLEESGYPKTSAGEEECGYNIWYEFYRGIAGYEGGWDSSKPELKCYGSKDEVTDEVPECVTEYLWFCDPDIGPRETNGGCGDEDGDGLVDFECAGCKAGDPIDGCGYQNTDAGLEACAENLKKWHYDLHDPPRDWSKATPTMQLCYKTRQEVIDRVPDCIPVKKYFCNPDPEFAPDEVKIDCVTDGSGVVTVDCMWEKADGTEALFCPAGVRLANCGFKENDNLDADCQAYVEKNYYEAKGKTPPGAGDNDQFYRCYDSIQEVRQFCEKKTCSSEGYGHLSVYEAASEGEAQTYVDGYCDDEPAGRYGVQESVWVEDNLEDDGRGEMCYRCSNCPGSGMYIDERSCISGADKEWETEMCGEDVNGGDGCTIYEPQEVTMVSEASGKNNWEVSKTSVRTRGYLAYREECLANPTACDNADNTECISINQPIYQSCVNGCWSTAQQLRNQALQARNNCINGCWAPYNSCTSTCTSTYNTCAQNCQGNNNSCPPGWSAWECQYYEWSYGWSWNWWNQQSCINQCNNTHNSCNSTCNAVHKPVQCESNCNWQHPVYSTEYYRQRCNNECYSTYQNNLVQCRNNFLQMRLPSWPYLSQEDGFRYYYQKGWRMAASEGEEDCGVQDCAGGTGTNPYYYWHLDSDDQGEATSGEDHGYCVDAPSCPAGWVDMGTATNVGTLEGANNVSATRNARKQEIERPDVVTRGGVGWTQAQQSCQGVGCGCYSTRSGTVGSTTPHNNSPSKADIERCQDPKIDSAADTCEWYDQCHTKGGGSQTGSYRYHTQWADCTTVRTCSCCGGEGIPPTVWTVPGQGPSYGKVTECAQNKWDSDETATGCGETRLCGRSLSVSPTFDDDYSITDREFGFNFGSGCGENRAFKVYLSSENSTTSGSGGRIGEAECASESVELDGVAGMMTHNFNPCECKAERFVVEVSADDGTGTQKKFEKSPSGVPIPEDKCAVLWTQLAARDGVNGRANVWGDAGKNGHWVLDGIADGGSQVSAKDGWVFCNSPEYRSLPACQANPCSFVCEGDGSGRGVSCYGKTLEPLIYFVPDFRVVAHQDANRVATYRGDGAGGNSACSVGNSEVGVSGNPFPLATYSPPGSGVYGNDFFSGINANDYKEMYFGENLTSPLSMSATFENTITGDTTQTTSDCTCPNLTLKDASGGTASEFGNCSYDWTVNNADDVCTTKRIYALVNKDYTSAWWQVSGGNVYGFGDIRDRVPNNMTSLEGTQCLDVVNGAGGTSWTNDFAGLSGYTETGVAGNRSCTPRILRGRTPCKSDGPSNSAGVILTQVGSISAVNDRDENVTYDHTKPLNEQSVLVQVLAQRLTERGDVHALYKGAYVNSNGVVKPDNTSNKYGLQARIAHSNVSPIGSISFDSMSGAMMGSTSDLGYVP